MRHRPHLAPLTAALLALLLLSAACGSDRSEHTTAQSTDSPADGAGVDEPSPDTEDSATEGSFTVVAYQREDLLGGSEIAFDSLLGRGRPVILNFWAAQCPPCLLEMPWFQAAHEQYEDGVLLVGVDVGPFTGLGSNEQGAELLSDLEITYPAVYAIDDEPLRQLKVTSMPFTMFFDADGEIVDWHGGILTEPQIQDWFKHLAAG